MNAACRAPAKWAQRTRPEMPDEDRVELRISTECRHGEPDTGYDRQELGVACTGTCAQPVQNPCSESHRSASSAAAAPLPADVMACR